MVMIVQSVKGNKSWLMIEKFDVVAAEGSQSHSAGKRCQASCTWEVCSLASLSQAKDGDYGTTCIHCLGGIFWLVSTLLRTLFTTSIMTP